MHSVHVPKEHLLGKSFRRTPFKELVCKRTPVKDFCRLTIVYTYKATFLKFPNEYVSMNKIYSACSALFGSNGCKTARTRT